jgi:serine phosphatase RsbU (regulator of sigma subunit)
MSQSERTDSRTTTVLVVDDNTANLGVIINYLKESGFDTPVATDGEIALKRAKHIRPDIILLDVMMPGIDGFETCRRLKSEEATKDIPVIFMTALNSTKDKVNGFKVGAVDYVTKPLHMEEVLARLNTHLRLQELTHKLQQTNRELSQANEELSQANQTIMLLNAQLKDDNLRMKSELEVAHRIQQMALPVESELKQIKELDIVGFMEPAEDVAGDYYDVLTCNDDGKLKMGIGDVTGHGLESGVLMLMVQTTVRALLLAGIEHPETFLNVLNHTIYKNVKRMETDKNLTLCLLDYQDGQLRITGQHEDVLIVRQDSQVERINTVDLGFMVGVIPNIGDMLSHFDIQLEQGDGIVLYTDGITEARNLNNELYGVEQLCKVVSCHWHLSAQEIQQAVITDVKQYIGTQKIFDDMTLLVLKRG